MLIINLEDKKLVCVSFITKMWIIFLQNYFLAFATPHNSNTSQHATVPGTQIH